MKNSRKLLSIALVFTLVMAILLPTTRAEASKISLNKKTATLDVGKSIELKVKGTKKTFQWTTTKKKIATVSKDGKVTAKKAGKAIITATLGEKSYSCKIIVLSGNIKEAIGNTNEFLNYELWDAFYTLRLYITTGKNASNRDINISLTLSRLNIRMKELDKYNAYITSLSGSQYTDLKASWKKVYKESINLYSIIKTTTPTAKNPTYVFNTEPFETAYDAFDKEVEFFD